jgi:hypothetical protein
MLVGEQPADQEAGFLGLNRAQPQVAVIPLTSGGIACLQNGDHPAGGMEKRRENQSPVLCGGENVAR